MGLIADRGPAGRMLRIVLPIAILPIGLSAPALYAAQRLGCIGTAVGMALFGVVNLALLYAGLLRASWLLRGEHVARRRPQDEIQSRSLHDSLTGLANRPVFMEQLARRAALADRRTSLPFAICSLELDGLDRVGGAAGPDVGERIVTRAAEVIRDCVRASDMVARLGGGKFGIMLEEIADAKDIDLLAERILSSVPAALAELAGGVPIAVSIGAILKTSGHDRPAEMLREADAALSAGQTARPRPAHAERLRRLRRRLRHCSH